MAGGAGNPLPLDSVFRLQPLNTLHLQRCSFVSFRYDVNDNVIELGRLATGRMNHGSVSATHLKKTSHLIIRSPLLHSPHVSLLSEIRCSLYSWGGSTFFIVAGGHDGATKLASTEVQ